MTEETEYDVLVVVLMDRLVNQTARWGKQWVDCREEKPKAKYALQEPDMDTKGGKYQHEPVSASLVTRMLRGTISCAWAAIDEQGASRWLCFDSDTTNGELDKLEASLRTWGLHVIREGRRNDRDGHVWILFDAPVKADLLIILGTAMMKAAGVHAKSKQHRDGIELFPNGKIGKPVGYSQVRSPFSINLKPEANGARGWFDGVEHDFRAQLEWLAQQPLNKASDAIREARKLLAPAKSPVRQRKSHQNVRQQSNRADLWQYARQQEFTGSGDYRNGPCPSCRLNGKDRTGNNMWVHSSGAAGCYRGCAYWDIHRAAS